MSGEVNVTSDTDSEDNWWALLATALVLATAAGNILVCLAIAWERRLQNVTNYFLMSLAITDLMVAVLVMPLGILTLVRGFFPLPSAYCLAWICLDVLFCTASIMHLCTISVDRYLSLRYPMRFGRNKTRRRVTLKIVFVWLLSLAMSLPLSLMYSQDQDSVLVDGTCQIPDPVYKLVGSIVCFYIPLGVMLLTYALTVRLLAVQQHQLGGSGSVGGGSASSSTTGAAWASGWLGGPQSVQAMERRGTWRRFLLQNPGGRGTAGSGTIINKTCGRTPCSTPQHGHSAASTDTELTTLDTHELWIPESTVPDPTPKAMSALSHFGAEMLKLSRGLETVAKATATTTTPRVSSERSAPESTTSSQTSIFAEQQPAVQADSTSMSPPYTGHECSRQRGRAATFHARTTRQEEQEQGNTTPTTSPTKQSPWQIPRRRGSSFHETRRWRNNSESSTASDEHLASPSFNMAEPYKIRTGKIQRQTADASKTRLSTRKSESISPPSGTSGTVSPTHSVDQQPNPTEEVVHQDEDDAIRSITNSNNNQLTVETKEDQGSTSHVPKIVKVHRKSVVSFPLPPPCTCPYFGEQSGEGDQKQPSPRSTEVVIVPTIGGDTDSKLKHHLIVPGEDSLEEGRNNEANISPKSSPTSSSATSPNKKGMVLTNILKARSSEISTGGSNMIVTWDTKSSNIRHRGSGIGGTVRTILEPSSTSSIQGNNRTLPLLRRAATLRHHNGTTKLNKRAGTKTGDGVTGGTTASASSSPCLLVRYGSGGSPSPRSRSRSATVRSHHSRNSSVISRTSSRHGRIIRLEQKATKVLGVVFFTFVILWAPFFVLNLVPTVCGEECERNIDHRVFDFVTWLGYASSMVNPIFYTIFNKVFRQAFKKVLLCQYRKKVWRPPT
ncbi:uncharacterized protein 5-HT2B [Anabrus simplex]|uniref:uncharacterized protein 5-HT2B n=1 Tax=Anabrus simplex TaxID=316456 RepID=UPI0035A27051